MGLTPCRCGRNAFVGDTCLFCGTGNAEAAAQARRARHPATVSAIQCADRRPWTEAMVIAAIRRWHRETGRTPRLTEWSRGGAWWPSNTHVGRLFGTWKDGIRAAGFEPPAQGRPPSRVAERVLA